MVQAAYPRQRDHLPEFPRLDRASDRRVAVEPHVRAVDDLYDEACARAQGVDERAEQG